MTALYYHTDHHIPNPLDVAEQIIMDRDWAFDRPADEELVAEMAGNWCHYRVWLAWQELMGAMIFTCAFDTKVPQAARAKLHPLLARVNEKMWLGHFDISEQDGSITFRHTLLLRGSKGVTAEQLEDLLDIAFTECERFYPAFQSVLWGGKNCDEALEAAVFETVGEA